MIQNISMYSIVADKIDDNFARASHAKPGVASRGIIAAKLFMHAVKRGEAMQRRFTGQQRKALYLRSNGKCAQCGVALDITNFHADHVKAFSRGGMTDEVNGQALCPACNLKKGSKDATGGK